MRPITEFLIEFPRALPPTMLSGSPEDAGTEPPSDAETLGLALAEARQAGAEDARAQGDSACAERIAALRETHGAEMTLARARWAADEGAVIADAIRSGLQRLEATVAAGVAAVLMPVLDEALRVRAATELAEAVGQLLAGGHGTAIEVRGAPDLLGPVRAAFADNPVVAVADGDQPELSITAGDTLVTSQIEAWSARLRAALEIAA